MYVFGASLELRISMVSSICSSFCLPWEGIGEYERASELSHAVASSYPQCFVSIGRFIRRSIRTAPAATRLKPSGENIVSDLASPPATTSLLLAMISYSTSRVRERNKERNRVETGKGERKRERERVGGKEGGNDRGRKRGETEGADSVRILDRLNGPYMLPLIEQQITGIVSRFYSKTTRYGTAARNQRCSLEWKLIMKQKKKKKLTLNAMLINAGLVLIAVLNRVLRPTVIPCLPPQTTLTPLRFQ